MMQIFQVAALAVATLGTGAATMTVLNKDIPDLAVPDGPWKDSGALDGMTFSIDAYDEDSGSRLEDELVFRDGTFQSVDCQQYCDFGWSDYQTKVVDGVLHWTVTTNCSEAPHTVVWYGTQQDGAISVDFSWTTRRWYWTNQIRGSGTGELLSNTSTGVTG